MKDRIILLNALPLNSFLYFNFNASIRRIENLEQLKKEIERLGGQELLVNFIRHPATIKLLQQKLGYNLTPVSVLYTYFPGDHIFVVTLSQWQERGKEKEQLEESDILIYEVKIYGGR
jgi:hypothetical protein